MQIFYKKWIRIVLLNLLIVAVAGVLLRYKILWSLPFIDYKNLLHAHSHFAFNGWVSLCLSVCLAGIINRDKTRIRVYSICFCVMLITAYGMLFSFLIGGYFSVSIFFSTLSIFVSWYFVWLIWKDISRSELPVSVLLWFRAGLIFYMMSAAGPFYLARLMMSGDTQQQWYIGSIYFFLHFQYNGWFTFAVIGLFMGVLCRSGIRFPENITRKLFWLLSIACGPAFFLSALWMQLPEWLYWLAVIGALIQLFCLGIMLTGVFGKMSELIKRFNTIPMILWALSVLAFTLKILMQGVSVIPKLNYLAFGYRPVVTGYLHLILLGFVSLFLLGYIIQAEYVRMKSFRSQAGISCFISGVVLNEIFLFVQALNSIAGKNFSIAGYCLLGAALLMLFGITLFYLSQLNNNIFKYGSISIKQREPAASPS